MTTKSTPEPKLYSVRAAAAMLGIGKTTAWKFVYDGTLETVHIGKRRLVRAASLDRLIANGTRKHAA